jgi:pimeloyl-ACP methyl ester carboxylesterase
MVTIPEVGHTLVMEKPDEFNQIVADFRRTSKE